jgi:hypothetical protein
VPLRNLDGLDSLPVRSSRCRPGVPVATGLGRRRTERRAARVRILAAGCGRTRRRACAARSSDFAARLRGEAVEKGAPDLRA